MKLFKSPSGRKGGSFCSGRASRTHTGGPYDRPTRLIPDYAYLVTSVEKRNSYYYRSNHGVPVFDARGVWLRQTNGDLVESDPRRSSSVGGRQSISSDDSGVSRRDPANPYVPLMRTFENIQITKLPPAPMLK